MREIHTCDIDVCVMDTGDACEMLVSCEVDACEIDADEMFVPRCL